MPYLKYLLGFKKIFLENPNISNAVLGTTSLIHLSLNYSEWFAIPNSKERVGTKWVLPIAGVYWTGPIPCPVNPKRPCYLSSRVWTRYFQFGTGAWTHYDGGTKSTGLHTVCTLEHGRVGRRLLLVYLRPKRTRICVCVWVKNTALLVGKPLIFAEANRWWWRDLLQTLHSLTTSSLFSLLAVALPSRTRAGGGEVGSRRGWGLKISCQDYEIFSSPLASSVHLPPPFLTVTLLLKNSNAR